MNTRSAQSILAERRQLIDEWNRSERPDTRDLLLFRIEQLSRELDEAREAMLNGMGGGL